MDTNSPYYKPEKPKNSWQLLQWVIFEPLLVKKYKETLSKKEQRNEFLNFYKIIAVCLIFMWLSGNLLITIVDFPYLFPNQYESSFIKNWNQFQDLGSRYIYILSQSWFYTAFGLVMGLIMGLFEASDKSFSFGLLGGWSLGLMSGLIAGMTFGLPTGLIIGLSMGLAAGSLGLALGLIFGMIIGLVGGVIFGLIGDISKDSFDVGVFTAIGFLIMFYLLHFRVLPFYLLYVLRYWRVNFLSNPYLRDGLIWLPFWRYREQFIQLALKEPEQVAQFIKFLQNYRPLQRKLTNHLLHGKAASYLQNRVLQVEGLHPIYISEDFPTLLPDKAWGEQLVEAKRLLLKSQQESNIYGRLDAFTAFKSAFIRFEEIHHTQHPIWKAYYTKGFQLWRGAIEIEWQKLQAEAAPYTRNPYQSGNPLNPQRNREVFRGREDLRRKLDMSLKNAETLPLFLIQGQRRVGKTSLLYFLSELLTGRFKVIQMDLQSTTECENVPVWLDRIRYHVDEAFDIEAQKEKWKAGDNWAQSWNELSQYLQALSQKENYRIVLAFDEYESLHLRGLRKDVSQGSTLLDNMRSFSQHQREVIFLFAGAHLFSELINPDWGNYFVQAIHLKVDYLSEKDSLDLIVHPYHGFDIHYKEGVPEKIYELTQGHPAILQTICYELVELANDEVRKELGKADLEKVLQEKILFPGNAPLNVFWKQFCKKEIMKETVRAIILKQDITDRKSLRKLLLHEFVVKNEDGSYRMRAPIFEQWVRKFDLEI